MHQLKFKKKRRKKSPQSVIHKTVMKGDTLFSLNRQQDEEFYGGARCSLCAKSGTIRSYRNVPRLLWQIRYWGGHQTMHCETDSAGDELQIVWISLGKSLRKGIVRMQEQLRHSGSWSKCDRNHSLIWRLCQKTVQFLFTYMQFDLLPPPKKK